MPTLRELQIDFMAAILGDGAPNAAGCGPAAPRLAGELVAGEFGVARRLAIYADNAEQHFIQSLRKSFPVVHRLVGENYFTQCAREFRRLEPSTSGDLQHVGAAFPAYWQRRHGSDEYRYLADMARLEWLYQESLTAANHPPFDFAKLARVPAAGYDLLRFRLHPSVRLYASEFPALAIWRENLRGDQEPALIDLSSGGDRVLLARAAGSVALHPLTVAEFAFLQRIAAGAGFAACVAAAAEVACDFDASGVLEKCVRERVIVDLCERT